MPNRLIICIVVIIFTATNCLAAGEKVNKPGVTADKFFSSAYWTALGFYENEFDSSDDAYRYRVKSFAVCAADNVTSMVFRQGEKWLDSATLNKRSKKILALSKLGNIAENACDTPTKQLVLRILTEPRRQTDIDDIKVDGASLQGRAVKVQGKGVYIMNQFMLIKNNEDTSPIMVNIEELNRKQRKEILQKCSKLMTPCDLTVHGTASNNGSQFGISATIVEW